MDVEEKILKALGKFDTANSHLVSALSGIPQKKVKEKMNRMERIGMIESLGPRVSTYYRLKKKRMML